MRQALCTISGAILGVLLIWVDVSSSFANDFATNSMALFESCKEIADSSDDLSELRPQKSFDAGWCLGVLNAERFALMHIHDLIFSKVNDYNYTKQYLTIAGSTPDICIPVTVTPHTLAKIVVEYGQNHPETLNFDPYLFVPIAYMEAYSCRPKLFPSFGRLLKSR